MGGIPAAIVNRFEHLFADIDEKNELFAQRPLLAHYTSISNAESILRNREIWFSNPLYLNDSEELRFGLNQGHDLILFDEEIEKLLLAALGNQADLDNLRENFSKIFKQYEEDFAIDTFVLSFCNHQTEDSDGKLSMWRGYGANGNGACIVFDSAQLAEVDDSPLVFGRMHYASRDQRILQLREYLTVLCDELHRAPNGTDDIFLAAWYYFERIKIFALFTKHAGFSEEEEWRLVYLPERDKDKLLTPFIDYHITPNGIQPKLKFPIQPIAGVTPNNLNIEQLVSRIILGPTTSSYLAQTMFAKFLQKLKLGPFVSKVVASTIPFRQL